MALLYLMICKSSCVWDLLLYYFTELPQPIHGFKGTGCSGQWGSPKGLRASGAPLRQAAEGRRPQRYMLGAETTDSSAEVVQGDPLSAREISSWCDVCTSGMVSCTGIIVSYQSCFHCSIRLKLEFARDAAWRLKGRRSNVGVDGWGLGCCNAGMLKGDERCLVEPT